MKQILKNKKLSNALFILWAGGAALLSYSLVYALRKPYTAAAFEGMELFGMDYKVAVTTIQILGYLVAKFAGIKLISELKREQRFKFFIISVIIAELSLIGFGAIPAPLNALVMFINGLSLGCMWGIIFSFIEGRRVTDMLASLLGVSIVFSSGTSKSIGLFAMNDLNIDQFWMPAVIGAVAFPLLILMGYILKRLPNPSEEDMEHKSERVTLNSAERKALFRRYSPILILLLSGTFLLTILRDVKEDFLVSIVDMEGQSSWLFAQIDTVITVIILGIFAVLTFCKSNIKALITLLSLVVFSCIAMSYVSFYHATLNLSPIVWLFVQSISLYIAYLTFQTIFFDRFIACFKIKGNVGFFIALIDFIGYAGTVILLFTKEMLDVKTDWFILYNNMALIVGLTSTIFFIVATILLVKEYRRSRGLSTNNQLANNLQPTL